MSDNFDFRLPDSETRDLPGPWLLGTDNVKHCRQITAANGAVYPGPLGLNIPEEQARIEATTESVNRAVAEKVLAELEAAISSNDGRTRSMQVVPVFNRRIDAFTDPKWFKNYPLRPEEVTIIDAGFAAFCPGQLGITYTLFREIDETYFDDDRIVPGARIHSRERTDAAWQHRYSMGALLRQGLITDEDFECLSQPNPQIVKRLGIRYATHWLNVSRQEISSTVLPERAFEYFAWTLDGHILSQEQFHLTRKEKYRLFASKLKNAVLGY